MLTLLAYTRGKALTGSIPMYYISNSIILIIIYELILFHLNVLMCIFVYSRIYEKTNTVTS